jgi:hypothetical protein
MTDLSEQLRVLTDRAAEPIALEEVAAHPVQIARPSPSRRDSKTGRPIWWAAAAAAAVVLAAVTTTLVRHDSDPPTVATPQGTVTADSYPVAGSSCGGGRLESAMQIAGPSSAQLCVGIYPVESDQAKLVYLTSRAGTQILGGWVIGSCPQYYSSSGGPLTLHDDDSEQLAIGVVPPTVAAVQFTLDDGSRLTAKSAHIDGIDDAAFYAIVVPATVAARLPAKLDAAGEPTEGFNAPCTPEPINLPPEVVTPVAAVFIEESSHLLGARVGDPCPAPNDSPGARVPMMSAVISGDPATGDCRVIAWTPFAQIPGLDLGAFYAQDGTVLSRAGDPQDVAKTTDAFTAPASSSQS